MITTHTQLLNALIEKYKLQSYLEIGVQTPAQNFDKINVRHKVGVDPEIQSKELRKVGSSEQLIRCTSDDYFTGNHPYGQNELGIVLPKFSIVFIDGLHHADQVKRDFENSLRCLNDNGFILIHDVLPENEAGTLVPRIQRQWWGDVYKWAMTVRNYPGIRFVTFNIDNGCMLVWKDATSEPNANYTGPLDWETYKSIGNVLLNVVNEVII